ncbi:unnamed protein product [Amoebophrya sp. A25]|nr:unnamed protein product [Amoebophrya sp. A25]|eukprot:GSA25T00009217001.1
MSVGSASASSASCAPPASRKANDHRARFQAMLSEKAKSLAPEFVARSTRAHHEGSGGRYHDYTSSRRNINESGGVEQINVVRVLAALQTPRDGEKSEEKGRHSCIVTDTKTANYMKDPLLSRISTSGGSPSSSRSKVLAVGQEVDDREITTPASTARSPVDGLPLTSKSNIGAGGKKGHKKNRIKANQLLQLHPDDQQKQVKEQQRLPFQKQKAKVETHVDEWPDLMTGAALAKITKRSSRETEVEGIEVEGANINLVGGAEDVELEMMTADEDHEPRRGETRKSSISTQQQMYDQDCGMMAAVPLVSYAAPPRVFNIYPAAAAPAASSSYENSSSAECQQQEQLQGTPTSASTTYTGGCSNWWGSSSEQGIDAWALIPYQADHVSYSSGTIAYPCAFYDTRASSETQGHHFGEGPDLLQFYVHSIVGHTMWLSNEFLWGNTLMPMRPNAKLFREGFEQYKVGQVRGALHNMFNPLPNASAHYYKNKYGYTTGDRKIIRHGDADSSVRGGRMGKNTGGYINNRNDQVQGGDTTTRYYRYICGPAGSTSKLRQNNQPGSWTHTRVKPESWWWRTPPKIQMLLWMEEKHVWEVIPSEYDALSVKHLGETQKAEQRFRRAKGRWDTRSIQEPGQRDAFTSSSMNTSSNKNKMKTEADYTTSSTSSSTSSSSPTSAIDDATATPVTPVTTPGTKHAPIDLESEHPAEQEDIKAPAFYLEVGDFVATERSTQNATSISSGSSDADAGAALSPDLHERARQVSLNRAQKYVDDAIQNGWSDNVSDYVVPLAHASRVVVPEVSTTSLASGVLPLQIKETLFFVD